MPSPRRGAGRGTAKAGGRRRRRSAPWRGAAGHRAFQRRRVHVLQEGCQRCVPCGWLGGAAGTGRGLRGDGQRRGYAKHGRAGAGIFPVPGGCWARRCSASVPASPVPLAGWLGSPGRALSQPLVPEFMGTTCLPRFPLLPVGRSSGRACVPGESGVPRPSCSCVLAEGVPESYASRLHGDPPPPRHLQSTFRTSQTNARASYVASGLRDMYGASHFYQSLTRNLGFILVRDIVYIYKMK